MSHPPFCLTIRVLASKVSLSPTLMVISDFWSKRILRVMVLPLLAAADLAAASASSVLDCQYI